MRPALWAAHLIALCAMAAACDGRNTIGTGFTISDGVTLMGGIDTNKTTVLLGDCRLQASVGRIDCGGLTIRLNTPGVWQGIGWELRDPTMRNCAGSSVAAPKLAIFSFGSLSVPANSTLRIYDPTAVALVAANSIDIKGQILSYVDDPFGGSIMPGSAKGGPSPGSSASETGTQGAGGAGAATAGATGGNAGAAGGPAVPPQLDPMCCGSVGGFIGHQGGFFVGGPGIGGGAILVAARHSVTLDGAVDCGVHADGGDGTMSMMYPGPGGGSGGVVMVETPSLTIASSCGLFARGGKGGNQVNGAAGGVGGTDSPPAAGGDGAFGGGGGGAAGFIRVRTKGCPTSYGGSQPTPSCSPLG